MCFVNYNIAIQITDFGVLQKSSKRFLISICFTSGEGGHPLPAPPPPLLATSCLVYTCIEKLVGDRSSYEK